MAKPAGTDRRKRREGKPDYSAGGFTGFAGDLRRSTTSLLDLLAAMAVESVNDVGRGTYGIYQGTPLRTIGALDPNVRALNPEREDLAGVMQQTPLQVSNPFPLTEGGQRRMQSIGEFFQGALESETGQRAMQAESDAEQWLNERFGSQIPGALFATAMGAFEVGGGRAKPSMKTANIKVKETNFPWKARELRAAPAGRVNLVMNPNRAEILDAFPDDVDVRFMVDDMGNLYVWPADQAIHQQVLDAISLNRDEVDVYSDYIVPASELFEEFDIIRDKGDFSGEFPSYKPTVLDDIAGSRTFTLRDGKQVEVNPSTISSRLPTGKTALENPDTEYLQAGYEAMQANPQTFTKNVQAVTEYPNYRPMPGVTTPSARAESFINDLTGNLMWLYDSIDPQVRDVTKQWYEGTQAIVDRFEQAYPGLSREQYTGVIAALSPQKDWFQNVSLAERLISTVQNAQNYGWDDAMTAWSQRYIASQTEQLAKKGKTVSPAVIERFRSLAGKQLSEIEDPLDRAWWVRAFDEAHNPREFNSITPTGQYQDVVRTGYGATRDVAWGSGSEIAKALRIIEDGSMENISRNLGDAHKVRSFYNNMVDPNSPLGDVTIDTHAVAAALLRPVSGTSKEAGHAFGTAAGVSNNKVAGSKGTYGLYAEAYRRAAQELGIQPRQLQSIVWERAREMFPDTAKRDTFFTSEADRIWQQYREKRITINEAREAISDLTRAVDTGLSGTGIPEAARLAADPGELPVRGVSGRGSAADPGAGSRITPTVQEGGFPGRRAIAVNTLRSNVDRSVTGGSAKPFRQSVTRDRTRNVGQFELAPQFAEGLNNLKISTPPVREVSGITGAREFYQAVKDAKANNKYGAQVSLAKPDEYQNMRLFLTDDGTAGFALKGDTIVSLFSKGDSPHTNISTELVLLGIQEGGRKLDNYDTFLSKIYKRLGFEETDRFPWDPDQAPNDWDPDVYRDFNGGEPDYVFMEYRPSGSLTERMASGSAGDYGSQEFMRKMLERDPLAAGRAEAMSQPGADIDLSRFDERLRSTLQQQPKIK